MSASSQNYVYNYGQQRDGKKPQVISKERLEEIKAEIEKQGGKVAGSVSAKTGYLINNDLLSQSGKNKKAKELGIKIIDEETIMKWLETGVTE